MGRTKGSKKGVYNRIKFICKICEKEFFVIPSVVKNKRGKYCSQKCYWESMSILCRIKCAVCGKIFKAKPSAHRKYCSEQCFYSTNRGSNHYCWKGNKKYNDQNYSMIYQPFHPFTNKDKYVREHRLIIEKQIGRYLLPEEKTHHLNRIKDDNRLQNLIVFINNSAHIRFHKNPYNVKPSEIIFDGRNLT